MSEDFECPLCYQIWDHAYGCPNEALEAIGEYDSIRPTKCPPDLEKARAKKAKSKHNKSAVKKVGSRPTPSR